MSNSKKHIFFYFIIFFFQFCLLEIGLHIVYYFTYKSFLWNKPNDFKVGYVRPTNDRRKYTLRESYSDETNKITVNELGFRNNGNEKNINENIIISIGDSVPFGSGVKDNETYPSILDELVGENAKVINAGVSSYNIRQSFDRLKFDVLKNYPKERIILITLQAANDLALLTHYRKEWTPDRTWADIRWKESWDTPTRIAVYFFALKIFKNEEENHAEYPDDKMLLSVESTLKEVSNFCFTYKIPILLLSIDPFYYQSKNTQKNADLPRWNSLKDYVMVWEKTTKKLNQELYEAAKISDCIYYLDTRTFMDNLERKDTHIDYIHYSPYGNKLIANLIFEFIKEKGLVKSY